MDKHYGWQEGRGSQTPPGRMQNGQRWNERARDDNRDVRSGRGGDGWEDDDRQWTSAGGNLDREDYPNERDEFGGQSRGGYNQGQRFGSQRYRNQGYGAQGYGGSQGFSGGHYGGYANEGFPGQGNYGGNRGFSNQGYSGERSNQSWGGQRREQSGQGDQSWGQTFGQGYAGSDYESRGFSGQGTQGFGQGPRGQQRYGVGSTSQGRGFAGRGPKGYQRSDERVKEQLSERLMDDDDIDASEISIEVKNGEVTLSGTVGSREEKRAAEEIAEQSPGVRDVQNHLRVSQEASSGSTQQFGQSGRAGNSASTGSASTQSKSRSTERE